MPGISFDTSANTITINLIFRALGMAFLTVPLTMLAVSSLPPAEIPQGAALNNMMRQLGGAFGISIINTYTVHRVAIHRTDLLSNINSTNPYAVGRLNDLTAYFQQKGFGAIEAKMKGIAVMEQTVVRQSAMLSYVDDFFLIGLLFAVTLPLLLLVIRAPKNSSAAKMVISDH